jgi:cyclopropane fatty-acyl-phospholipid synthase-like methyltransferase
MDSGQDSRAYDADYYENNGSSGDRIALRWYAALIERHAPAGRAVDFGAGPGWMVRRVATRRSCDGVEISEYARRECAERNPGASVYESTDVIRDGTYAAVSAIHVVEHISAHEVPDVLADILRILVPGGLLLMVTPDSSGRAARIKGAQWRALSDPTHINLQGHETWHQVLTDAGFQIVREGSDGLWDPPYTNRVADLARLPRIALDVLGGRLSLPVGGGESYLCLATRPTGN